MDEDKKIRLLLVDDHPVVRDGVRMRFASQARIEIVGEASDGQEAVQKAQELSPDIVFVDIGMPGMSGLEIIRRLRQTVPQAKAIVLTVHASKEYILQALRSGARGYLLKDSSSAQLLSAVEAVESGEIYIPADVSKKIVQEYAKEPEYQRQRELSRREQEVLALIAEGYTNKEIADQLSVGVRTIETHRENLMHKLDIHSVVGLTKYAISTGLIQLT